MVFKPDRDIRDYLVSNVTEATLVSGTNIFASGVRPTQDSVVSEEAVFIYPILGDRPESMSSSTVSEWRPEYRIWIRSARNDYGGSLDLARQIRSLLQSDGAPVIAGYTDIQVIDSEPEYRGENGDGRHQWALDVLVIFYE